MNCPLTRTLMRSGPSWNTPDGVTAFCACSEAMIERRVETERRDLPGREFEVDHLILRAENVDLADIGDGQDLGARISSTWSRNCRWVRPSAVKA